MSAKSDLSARELRQMLPTVQKLIADCWQHDPSEWGLCQHSDDKTEVAFRLPDGKWKLQVSLESVTSAADHKFVDADYGSVALFFAVELDTPHHIECLLIDLLRGEKLSPGISVDKTSEMLPRRRRGQVVH